METGVQTVAGSPGLCEAEIAPVTCLIEGYGENFLFQRDAGI